MPRTPQPHALAELAAALETKVSGGDARGGEIEIAGFAALAEARADELSFVRDASLLPALADSKAAAVIAPVDLGISDRPVLASDQPGHDFSRLLERFAPRWRPTAGIASGAHVDPTANVDPTAAVEPGARIGPHCRVGARTIIGANAVLSANVEVGADGWIHPGVVLREDTLVGDRVVLQPNVVIGGDGFGYVPDAAGRPVAMAQRGRVVLEDEVEVGANTTIDRGTLTDTRIRRGAKIDNQVMIAHNCEIGEDVLIVAQTGLAGGTIVGDRAILMARAASTGHLRIGSGAFLGAGTGVIEDVPDGARVFGAPSQEERGWHRTVAALRRLPDLLKRVRRLERRLDEQGADSAGPSGSDPDSDS